MEKEDIAATEGGGGKDGQERRRRVPNGRCPRLRQRGRSSPVSQSAIAPSPRALAPQELASRALCGSLGGSSLQGGRADRACGQPGTAAAWGPLAQCGGRGAGRGCAPGGGGCSPLPLPFLPHATASRRWGAHPTCPGFLRRLRLGTELSVQPMVVKRGEAGRCKEVCELEVGEEEGVGL